MSNNLKKKEQELFTLAKNAWNYFDISDALLILDELKKSEIKTQLNEDQFNDLKIRMQWITLHLLSPDEQDSLISQNLLFALYDENFQLEKSFETLRAYTPDFIWPDETVPRLIKAFFNNEELLSKEKLLDENKKAVITPTLGNWLRDYTKIYGMDKQEKFIISKYLTISPNILSLSIKEKNALERLLLIFEDLKVFSLEQMAEEVLQKIQQEKQQLNTQREASRIPFADIVAKHSIKNSTTKNSFNIQNPIITRHPLEKREHEDLENKNSSSVAFEHYLNTQKEPPISKNIDQIKTTTNLKNNTIDLSINNQRSARDFLVYESLKPIQPNKLEESPKPNIEINTEIDFSKMEKPKK